MNDADRWTKARDYKGRTLVIAESRLLRSALLTLLVCVAWCTQAQAAPVQKTGYIAMSDGVRLRYAVELPAAAGRFPVAMKYDGTAKEPLR
ncbi:MAG TPA: hypothetical protein VK898_07745 [Chloroflexota bacterium]|nr:hypothetical protein [Chloroflexota bacterium]